MNAQVQLKKVTTARRSTKPKAPTGSFLRGCTFFTATPDGKVVGLRNPTWDRKSEQWKGRVGVELGDEFNPAAIARNPWLHMAPLVPDDEFDGCYMSNQAYFRLHLEQYVRHMTWLFHDLIHKKVLFAGLPRHKCIKAGIPYVSKEEKVLGWVKDALKVQTDAIEKQYSIKLDEIDPAAFEMDAILIDASESIRDTTRRYGRSNVIRRGAARA